ncbi:putative addiction module antidote protein [Escherichia coli]|uniref:helix-turn-helix domain-containing transcriptional regulator n=1 Tax=Escherichia coli TaxID=562 RepID=UPI00300D5751
MISLSPPTICNSALGDVARARNLIQLVRDVDGDPSLATVVKVAHALGLRLAFKPTHGGSAPAAEG